MWSPGWKPRPSTSSGRRGSVRRPRRSGPRARSARSRRRQWYNQKVAALMLALVLGEPLADARTAMDELRFDKALELLDSAERSGANGPKEMTEIQRLRGQALGSMGRADEATTAFRRWLALEPGGQLPEGSSPKI